MVRIKKDEIEKEALKKAIEHYGNKWDVRKCRV
jgi:hypothetical protein